MPSGPAAPASKASQPQLPGAQQGRSEPLEHARTFAPDSAHSQPAPACVGDAAAPAQHAQLASARNGSAAPSARDAQPMPGDAAWMAAAWAGAPAQTNQPSSPALAQDGQPAPGGAAWMAGQAAPAPTAPASGSQPAPGGSGEATAADAQDEVIELTSDEDDDVIDAGAGPPPARLSLRPPQTDAEEVLDLTQSPPVSPQRPSALAPSSALASGAASASTGSAGATQLPTSLQRITGAAPAALPHMPTRLPGLCWLCVLLNVPE